MSEIKKDPNGQLPVDPPGGDRTRYMILWAPKPDEEEKPKWREVGWYTSHSPEAAKLAAREDKDSGSYGELLDVAAHHGFLMRAVATRSWPESPGDLFVQETAWSTAPYGAQGGGDS